MSDSHIIRQAERAGYIIGWADGSAWCQRISDQRDVHGGFKTLEDAALAALADADVRSAMAREKMRRAS